MAFPTSGVVAEQHCEVQKNEAFTRDRETFPSKKRRENTPAACLFHGGSPIVRLADRHLVDLHLVFPARAADVPVPLCRDPAARLVPETWVVSVGLDFVVCP